MPWPNCNVEPSDRNAMSDADLYHDPWDVDLNADPYPMFARIRENTPLYYNAGYDFYALNPFDDVDKHRWTCVAVFSSSSAVRGWDSMPAAV